jgi:hypothetical protein
MLTPEHFRFSPASAGHAIVAHLVDYFSTPEQLSTGSGGEVWGSSPKDTRSGRWRSCATCGPRSKPKD